MKVRRAAEKDIPRIAELLLQVGGVHAAGRPDLFKSNARKYTDEELTCILRDDKRPVFVAEDERGEGICQVERGVCARKREGGMTRRMRASVCRVTLRRRSEQ